MNLETTAQRTPDLQRTAQDDACGSWYGGDIAWQVLVLQ